MTVNKLHHFVALMDEWRRDYPGDKLGEIIFRNEQLLTNIFWNNKSFQNVHKHPKGAEQLPDTIEKPDSVWSYWKDPNDQKDVYRHYIRGNYVVKTLNGNIEDAFLVDNPKRFEKGVLIY